MKYVIYGILIIVFGIGFVWSPYLLDVSKFKLSASITNLFDFLEGNKELKERVAELERENENLKVQIFNDKLTEPLTVKVYSIYPFNNIKEIAIAGGEDNRQEIGQIVTYGRDILIGKIKVVFDNHSIVETIFDTNFRTEVRIGEFEADGLFTGGNILKVSLLSKKADIKVGDLVVTAAKGYPYGLEVGRVKEVKSNLGSPLKEAILEPVIQLEDLRNVSIRD